MMFKDYENKAQKTIHAVDIPTDKWVHVRAKDRPITLKAKRILPGTCVDVMTTEVVEVECIAILGAEGTRLVPLTAFNKLYRRP